MGKIAKTKTVFPLEVSFSLDTSDTLRSGDLEKIKFDIFNYLNKKVKKRFKKSDIKTKLSFPKLKK